MARAQLSALTRRQTPSRSNSPKPPMLLAPTSPEEALAASINAVSGLLHYIQQILAGPMRSAPEFFKQYLRAAAKSSADLLKQLANRTDGLPVLDGLATASVELLALASEYDPESAAEIAEALEAYANRNGFAADTAIASVLASTRKIENVHAEAQLKYADSELWVEVEAVGQLRSTESVANVRIQGLVPVKDMNVIIESVVDL